MNDDPTLIVADAIPADTDAQGGAIILKAAAANQKLGPVWYWIANHPYSPPNGERYLFLAIIAPVINLALWGALVWFLCKWLRRK